MTSNAPQQVEAVILVIPHPSTRAVEARRILAAVRACGCANGPSPRAGQGGFLLT